MKYFGSASCLVLCVAIVFVECQEKPQPPKIGQLVAATFVHYQMYSFELRLDYPWGLFRNPQFSLQGAGGGKDHRNFVAGFNAGVGTRVWESKKKDASLDLGVNYGRGFARMDGHTFKSKPSYGFGGTFRWGKK
ncbi:uncharacterized protein TNIN_371121 [Trichonephila inaurata madagascariensis]|uniref:Uncharacterized protein n=1 Tax=Trichonephila inaurata madagascariensis TaxID=2747483 RepID=A0A8X6IZD7_9ARAC|nr:uncharacterized protein TNIN_371121 [Trichonephila inaurata madagascariensis]